MINKKIIEKNIRSILVDGLGLDLTDPNLKDTPNRVTRAFCEIFSGYNDDLDQYVKLFPAPKNNQMVIIKDILCYSMCSHHILPFSCYISIGYIPNDDIIGISKVERICKSICRKLQTQEYITEEICDYLDKILKPKGIIVVANNSEHMCMKMRGVETKTANITSTTFRGCFKEDNIKKEFLQLIK